MEALAESLYWLALNAYHEARGESTAGQMAVCHVVMNRVLTRGKPIRDIILAPDQFSWTIGVNPEMIPFHDMASFRKCLIAAATCLKERSFGHCLQGADHYFNPNVVLPSWAKSMTFVKTIGNHSFYRDDRQMRFK